MEPQRKTVTVRAPAKINLTLEILGRRRGGFHELRSILAPLDLCDDVVLRATGDNAIEVTVEAAAGVSLSSLCPPEVNLVTRAARLLREECGLDAGVAATVYKRIPICGGLGGGSADAAAALAGLNVLWGLGLTRARLAELGGRLGCDIPALVHGGVVVMEGCGERLRPVRVSSAASGAAQRFWLVVANPGVACPTREIYERHNGGLTVNPFFFHNMLLSIRSGDFVAAARYLFNGLQPVVFEHYPVVRALAGRLRDAGGLGVLLSGSGASVFALVRDEAHADAVIERLGGDFWSVKTTTLPDGVMAAHGPLEP